MNKTNSFSVLLPLSYAGHLAVFWVEIYLALSVLFCSVYVSI